MADLYGIDTSEVIVIDTETTGLDPSKDEVLMLSVIDGDGNVLFDDYIRPAHRKRWPNAAKINGVTWADVKDKKTLEELRGEISPLFSNAAVVVGYNVDFDLGMLEASGLPIGHVHTFDVMKEYSRLCGGGRCMKLVECAASFDYKPAPHGTLENAKATLHCYKGLLNNESYVKMRTEENERKERFRNIGIVVLIAGIFIAGASLGILLNSCSFNDGFFVAAGLSIVGFLAGVIMIALGFGLRQR